MENYTPDVSLDVQGVKGFCPAGEVYSKQRQLMLFMYSAHPQVEDLSFTWRRDTANVETGPIFQALAQAKVRQQSPFAATNDDTARLIHCQLEHTKPDPDDPVLKRLKTQGATDYVAVPMVFSDGTSSTVAFVCDGPGGFSDCEVEQFDQSATVLARLLEPHAVRRTARKLLETYLGKRTGEQVLKGYIERGAGNNIHAVIWFCDLRDSTVMANSMPRQSFLGVLNDFFDCTAGAALDHGGEVLRFVGDASLAIFPTGEVVIGAEKRCCDTASACLSALAAAKDAQDRLISKSSTFAKARGCRVKYVYCPLFPRRTGYPGKALTSRRSMTRRSFSPRPAGRYRRRESRPRSESGS